MANYQVLLDLMINPFQRSRNLRRYRQGLIYFFEGLSLHLKAGFSLSYSWPEVLSVLGEALPQSLQRDLAYGLTESGTSEGVKDVLNRLQKNKCIASHQMWFAVLSELYESGSNLTRGVEAITGTLRREQERELEAHCRNLPVKVNVVLMIFFLPPTFLWIFAPLVIEILEQFK